MYPETDNKIKSLLYKTYFDQVCENFIDTL